MIVFVWCLLPEVIVYLMTLYSVIFNTRNNVISLFISLLFFSVRLLSVLRGHSFFSSPPQRPMPSDFEGFSNVFFYIASDCWHCSSYAMKYRPFTNPIVSPGLVLILYIHGLSARQHGFPPTMNVNKQIQERVITAREVEKIKYKILRTLGMRTDLPNTTQNTPVITKDHVTSPVYKRTEVRVYRSEIPGKYST